MDWLTEAPLGVTIGMASKQQTEANRANAQRSTGPRTKTGKARSSRNAFRHGLSRWEPEKGAADILAETIGIKLAQSPDADAAQDLAEAELQVARIRDVRFRCLTALLADPNSAQVKDLAGLDRYEKVARAKQRRGLRGLLRK